ncbi:hypothetical protein [Sporocytophaga myxococcoides]|uniref:hypothetical protein n=1 Tax=Sporocytophaga myxococcoides TaxID=153721 RepID=UPI00040BA80C|nr:hypothetical protein [Sporocytophaga myxococcoides]
MAAYASYFIHFKNGAPSFKEIQSRFFDQTGLWMTISATLNINRIDQPYEQMISQIFHDAKQYSNLATEYRALSDIYARKHRKEVDEMLQQIQEKQENLNHIAEIRFSIVGFYEIEIDFGCEFIEILDRPGYYGVNSLIKTLIDLGGEFEDDKKKYSEEWKGLKHWHSYKWYNRPRK